MLEKDGQKWTCGEGLKGLVEESGEGEEARRRAVSGMGKREEWDS